MDWVPALARITCLLVVTGASAQDRREVTELGGPVRRDAVWRGTVTVTSDVIISNAVVRVEPGTVITFAPTGPAPARIILAGTRGKPTRLQLAGTEASPIVVTSAPGSPPAAIVVPLGVGRTGQQSDSISIPHGGLTATSTVFERLGSQRLAGRAGSRPQPAIHLQLADATDTLELAACRFRSCGPLLVNFVADRSQAKLTDCTFEASTGEAAVEFYGSGGGAKELHGNQADAAFRILAGPARLTDNLLIGERAALVITAPRHSNIVIRGNYVHNTTEVDTGRFCLRCTDSEATVEDNLLRGGTWVIQRAGKKTSGNVLSGTAGLISQKLGIETTTHQLIADLPADAEVADNLLLGPSYSHLVTGRGCLNPLIRRNVFDGGGSSGRGVHLNALANEEVAARIEDNVFVGFKRAAIYDEARRPESVASCRGNLFADTGRRFDLAGDACGGQEAAPTTRRQLGYSRLEEIDWVRTEADLTAGTTDVAAVIARIKARYPLPAAARDDKSTP